MFCPEGYFTPKHLEAAFSIALKMDAVRTTVFDSAGKNSRTIPATQIEPVVAACAQYFVHRFISEKQHHLRAASTRNLAVVRLDSWAVESTTLVRHDLPVTKEEANALFRSLEDRFYWLNQTDWTVDTAKRYSERKHWLNAFNGWSVFFPQSEAPGDYGTAINDLAFEIPRLRFTTKRLKRKVGRPAKYTLASDALAKLDPSELNKMPRKKQLTYVESEIGDTCCYTTLGKALNNLPESHRK